MYYPFIDPSIAGTVTTHSGSEMHMNPWAVLAYAAQMGQLDLDEEMGYRGPNVDIWLIVEIDKKNFSERIEYDEELDLLLAPEGKFVGFASTKAEADRMTTAKLKEVEVRGEPEDGIRHEVVADAVYITYKAEIKGQKELRKLLEFLKSEGMLKPQGN